MASFNSTPTKELDGDNLVRYIKQTTTPNADGNSEQSVSFNEVNDSDFIYDTELNPATKFKDRENADVSHLRLKSSSTEVRNTEFKKSGKEIVRDTNDERKDEQIIRSKRIKTSKKKVINVSSQKNSIRVINNEELKFRNIAVEGSCMILKLIEESKAPSLQIFHEYCTELQQAVSVSDASSFNGNALEYAIRGFLNLMNIWTNIYVSFLSLSSAESLRTDKYELFRKWTRHSRKLMESLTEIIERERSVYQKSKERVNVTRVDSHEKCKSVNHPCVEQNDNISTGDQRGFVYKSNSTKRSSDMIGTSNSVSVNNTSDIAHIPLNIISRYPKPPDDVTAKSTQKMRTFVSKKNKSTKRSVREADLPSASIVQQKEAGLQKKRDSFKLQKCSNERMNITLRETEALFHPINTASECCNKSSENCNKRDGKYDPQDQVSKHPVNNDAIRKRPSDVNEYNASPSFHNSYGTPIIYSSEDQRISQPSDTVDLAHKVITCSPCEISLDTAKIKKNSRKCSYEQHIQIMKLKTTQEMNAVMKCNDLNIQEFQSEANVKAYALEMTPPVTRNENSTPLFIASNSSTFVKTKTPSNANLQAPNSLPLPNFSKYTNSNVFAGVSICKPSIFPTTPSTAVSAPKAGTFSSADQLILETEQEKNEPRNHEVNPQTKRQAMAGGGYADNMNNAHDKVQSETNASPFVPEMTHSVIHNKNSKTMIVSRTLLRPQTSTVRVQIPASLVVPNVSCSMSAETFQHLLNFKSLDYPTVSVSRSTQKNEYSNMLDLPRRPKSSSNETRLETLEENTHSQMPSIEGNLEINEEMVSDQHESEAHVRNENKYYRETISISDKYGCGNTNSEVHVTLNEVNVGVALMHVLNEEFVLEGDSVFNLKYNGKMAETLNKESLSEEHLKTHDQMVTDKYQNEGVVRNKKKYSSEANSTTDKCGGSNSKAEFSLTNTMNYVNTEVRPSNPLNAMSELEGSNEINLNSNCTNEETFTKIPSNNRGTDVTNHVENEKESNVVNITNRKTVSTMKLASTKGKYKVLSSVNTLNEERTLTLNEKTVPILRIGVKKGNFKVLNKEKLNKRKQNTMKDGQLNSSRKKSKTESSTHTRQEPKKSSSDTRKRKHPHKEKELVSQIKDFAGASNSMQSQTSHSLINSKIKKIVSNKDECSIRCSSSRRRGLNALAIKKLEIILNVMWNMGASDFIKYPVKSNEFCDYYKHVKRPMFLETIGHKLKTRIYETTEQFVHDFRRTFVNAKLYHKDEAEYIKLAAIMEVAFNDLLEKNFPGWDFGHITGDPNEIFNCPALNY